MKNYLPTRIKKNLLLLLILLLLPFLSWAQPRTIEVVDQTTLECEGKVKLKFLAGIDETFDDYISYAELRVNGAQILRVSNGFDWGIPLNNPKEIDMGFEDWDYTTHSYFDNID